MSVLLSRVNRKRRKELNDGLKADKTFWKVCLNTCVMSIFVIRNQLISVQSLYHDKSKGDTIGEYTEI